MSQNDQPEHVFEEIPYDPKEPYLELTPSQQARQDRLIEDLRLLGERFFEVAYTEGQLTLPTQPSPGAVGLQYVSRHSPNGAEMFRLVDHAPVSEDSRLLRVMAFVDLLFPLFVNQPLWYEFDPARPDRTLSNRF